MFHLIVFPSRCFVLFMRHILGFLVQQLQQSNKQTLRPIPSVLSLFALPLYPFLFPSGAVPPEGGEDVVPHLADFTVD